MLEHGLHCIQATLHEHQAFSISISYPSARLAIIKTYEIDTPNRSQGPKRTPQSVPGPNLRIWEKHQYLGET